MEPESGPETDQPGWYRALPPLVLGTGLALSLLLWFETRQALVEASTGDADAVFPGVLLLFGTLLSLGLALVTWRLVRAHRLTVRICAIVDALSHCQGFRVVASPREPIE